MILVSLKADHGKFLCAEEGGGPAGSNVQCEQGGIIYNRPRGLMTANRESAGTWEHFDIVPSDEDGYYGLISCDGWIACCEDCEGDSEKGKNGIIVFNREAIGAWEKFKLILSNDGTRVSFESKCRPGYFIKAHPTGDVTLEQHLADGEAVAEPGAYETFVCDPPLVGVVGTKNPITGQLRVTDSGYQDDEGPYLPVGIHMGDLFSCYCYGHVDKVKDALAKISGAGYGLVQFWLNLGSLGGDYWAGREIGPEITPGYWDKLREFSDLLDSYGLKGIYCTGDYALRGTSWSDFGRMVGDLLVSREKNTGALAIAGNEAWQTGASSIDDLMEFVNGFESSGCHTPVTTTSPPTEDKAEIAAWCGGDYYCIHGWRGGEDHDRIRHIFSVPWEGDPPSYLGYQDEPTGPGDEVSVKASHCYDGRDVDASHLVALAIMSLMTNQGFNFFCSDGVKLNGDISSWQGFKEVANAVNLIPPDIMSWEKGFHFGDSQSEYRVFAPVSGNQVRFDHRIGPSGQIFGVLYGDEGEFSIRCERACHIMLRNYLGELLEERDYHDGDTLNNTFIRSQNAQPGQTSFIVEGDLL